MLHLYFPFHRNYKWTIAFLKGLLKICINNTWIIFNELGNNMNLMDVTYTIIHHLTGSYTQRVNVNKPLFRSQFDKIDHWPEKAKKNNCVQCLSLKKNQVHLINVVSVVFIYIHF